jgi:hypothetical protein
MDRMSERDYRAKVERQPGARGGTSRAWSAFESASAFAPDSGASMMEDTMTAHNQHDPVCGSCFGQSPLFNDLARFYDCIRCGARSAECRYCRNYGESHELPPLDTCALCNLDVEDPES